MTRLARYFRLFGHQFGASLATALAYRAEFVIGAVVAIAWTVWTIVPLLVVFSGRPLVAGWSFNEALLVVAWFSTLDGIVQGAISPSLVEVSQHIRLGTLDFLLLKPVDAQFLVSTTKFAPTQMINVVKGIVIGVIAFVRIGEPPGASNVALGAFMFLCALTVLYSLWILVVCASFLVVRLDNLAYLLTSVLDAGRWPVDVFRGAWRAIFTFVLPLAILTTFPARALLGTLSWQIAVWTACGALLFATASRLIWGRAIAKYTSASS